MPSPTPGSHYFSFSRAPQSWNQKPAPPILTIGSTPPVTLGSVYICHISQLLAEILIETCTYGRKPRHAVPSALRFSSAGRGYGAATSRACSTRAEAMLHEGQVGFHDTWSESGPEQSSWGLPVNATFCVLNFSIKISTVARAPGHQPPPWHGW